MPLNRSEKEAVVNDMARRLKEAEAVVVTDYRGLTVSQIRKLRVQLRPQNSEFHVIKNSLARRAFELAGLEPPDELLTGPTALMLLYEDLSSPSKTLLGFVKETNELLSIKGGLVGGRPMGADGVKALSELPSREELRALILGTFLAPQRRVVTVLSTPLRDLAGVLNARAEAGDKAA